MYTGKANGFIIWQGINLWKFFKYKSLKWGEPKKLINSIWRNGGNAFLFIYGLLNIQFTKLTECSAHSVEIYQNALTESSVKTPKKRNISIKMNETGWGWVGQAQLSWGWVELVNIETIFSHWFGLKRKARIGLRAGDISRVYPLRLTTLL